MKKAKELIKIFAEVLHAPTIVVLSIIGLIFSMLMFAVLIDIMFSLNDMEHVLEKSFLIFLYIEIVAAIRIYFNQDYHFPLRFFFYIGMTDIIRHIIIARDQPEHALTLSIALLVVTTSFVILEFKSKYLRKNKLQSEEEEIEL